MSGTLDTDMSVWHNSHMNYEEKVKRYLELEIAALRSLDSEEICAFLAALEQARLDSGAVYIMGNGGSATTASHWAGDFNKGLSMHLERKFRFVCLSDNLSSLMAIANDMDYEAIFVEQLRGRLGSSDLVIGISGSGNSPNILRAIEYANDMGVKTVGLTGYDGGKLRESAALSVHVPVNSMQIAEDIHLVLDHMLMAVFYEVLCGIDHISQS